MTVLRTGHGVAPRHPSLRSMTGEQARRIVRRLRNQTDTGSVIVRLVSRFPSYLNGCEGREIGPVHCGFESRRGGPDLTRRET